MPFDKKTFVIPNDTIFEEKNVVIKGDAILADRSFLDYGIITDKRVFIGEHTKINGEINAKDDIRIDLWSEVNGDIYGGSDVYLGEKVKVFGKVSVGRDFDVGDGVLIQKGFEAKGWINIRNPIPLVIYIFIYLLELLRQGKSKEVEKILDELDSQEEKFLISDCFFFVPKNSWVSTNEVRINGNCRIGAKCRVVGNYSVSGAVKIGAQSELYGAVRAGGKAELGDKVTVHGNLDCKGALVIGESSQILGDVKCDRVELFRNVIITGMLKATDGVRFITAYDEAMKQKLERFNAGVDSTENILG